MKAEDDGGLGWAAALISCWGSTFMWGRDTRVVRKLYFLGHVDDTS